MLGLEELGRPPLERTVRNPGDLLWAPRYAASFDLTDSQTVVAGVSGAFAPNASGPDTRTQIYGGDLYWKWKPSWQAAGFPFVSWQTEALGRRYEAGAASLAPPGGPAVVLPRETLFDWGLYSQVLYGFRRRWVAGLRGDWVSGDRGAFSPDAIAARPIEAILWPQRFFPERQLRSLDLVVAMQRLIPVPGCLGECVEDFAAQPSDCG